MTPVVILQPLRGRVPLKRLLAPREHRTAWERLEPHLEDVPRPVSELARRAGLHRNTADSALRRAAAAGHVVAERGGDVVAYRRRRPEDLAL